MKKAALEKINEETLRSVEMLGKGDYLSKKKTLKNLFK